jgi:hypothetical protein
MVVTLLVVPAIGASTAVTEPFCPPRPESGSGVASVCCDVLGDGPWAAAMEPRQMRRAAAARERFGETVSFERFMAEILYA